jgi:sulfatase maturation enzyme AslB (radical SAM superfamily)
MENSVKPKLTNCCSATHNLEEIQDFLQKLNSSKSDDLSFFKITPQGNDRYIIEGEVTQKDWDDLTLESWFW